MIPAYNKEIAAPEVVPESATPTPQQIQQLHEQILTLRQTVEYLQRENSRMKSDIQTLAAIVNRK